VESCALLTLGCRTGNRVGQATTITEDWKDWFMRLGGRPNPTTMPPTSDRSREVRQVSVLNRPNLLPIFFTGGWIIRAATAITILVLLRSSAVAVSLINSNLPIVWVKSISDFTEHYVETYSKYNGKRQEQIKQEILPKLVKDLVSIATWSEVLATTMESVSHGNENPQRLAFIAAKVQQPLESLVSTIRSIDPGWTGTVTSIDFSKALDQLRNGRFDFNDGRIWDLVTAHDMKPDETRKLAFGFRAEAQQLIEIVKQLIIQTDPN
jgi:hypothetical protein